MQMILIRIWRRFFARTPDHIIIISHFGTLSREKYST